MGEVLAGGKAEAGLRKPMYQLKRRLVMDKFEVSVKKVTLNQYVEQLGLD